MPGHEITTADMVSCVDREMRMRAKVYPRPGHEITTAEMVACVDREMMFRARVYPRWVKQGKLTQEKADLEGARMMCVRQRLVAAEAMEQAITRMMDTGFPLAPLEAAACFADVLASTAKRLQQQYPLP